MFTPMQTDLARKLLEEHKVPKLDLDTFALIKNGRCFIFSSAALEITRDLTGFWYLLTIFKLVPSAARDFFYKIFARNRYALFGKQDTCMTPSEEVRSRFIGI